MLIDDLFDRLVYRLRHSKREGPNGSPLDPNRKRTGRNSIGGQHGSSFFNNANRFVVDRSIFIGHQNNIITTGHRPVLKHIAKYANLDAAADSSARFPPPTCHPRTRLKIGDRLLKWLTGLKREHDIIWLYGPAGTGKSAVAQTFAERCIESGRLGASFFFSRPNDRNDPNTVIPTLVYQLAVYNPRYKYLVAEQLTNDPELLRKTRRTQFKKLIVEPYSLLQIEQHQSVQEPLLVILDGLDECNGEDAQREIIEMVNEVVRLKKDFPLIWLICSRPEPHLKYVFSRADFTVNCGREELAIDAESIADVDLYLRDGLAGIKAHFSDVTTPAWPPEEQTTELSQKASGHFAFASTALRYIGDPTYATPVSRLNGLLSFLGGVRTGTSNPLEALDALYTAILHCVPDDVLPTVKLLLGFSSFKYRSWSLKSAQYLCSFLHVDRATFYSAFRKLHSVIDVPSPESALRVELRFYHSSFEDYLRDPSRSGKFATNRDDVDLSFAKLCFSWNKTDLELFHTTDGPIFNKEHEHGILPGLEWASDDNRADISRAIATDAENWCWFAAWRLDNWDTTLLSQVRNFDFRHIRRDEFDHNWIAFVNLLWKMDSLSGIVRIEPHTEVDLRLLEYMKFMSPRGSKPATFPLPIIVVPEGDYFLLGHGLKATLFWGTGIQYPRFSSLNCDEILSKEQIVA